MDIATLKTNLQALKNFVNAVNLHEEVQPDGGRKISVSHDLTPTVAFSGVTIEGFGGFVVVHTTGVAEIAVEGVESLGLGNSSPQLSSPTSHPTP